MSIWRAGADIRAGIVPGVTDESNCRIAEKPGHVHDPKAGTVYLLS
ncbi:MAG: hypothetical protein GY903_31860 [Fuerstiella sp.]|nr:hypothetical protein [Fuerstiella sp.]MCP4859088.1 hypothetical protein [Fuerstiella sp.]